MTSMPRAANISTYKFSSSDELLLDANIWYLIYGPQVKRTWRIAVYSNALKSILKANSRIYIDVLIVSEFINRYARFYYDLLPSGKYKNFKLYRHSPEFKPVAIDIAADVKLVLRQCTPTASYFDTLDTDLLLNEFALGNSDFNDQVLVELCKTKNLKFVTDDGDFKGSGIPLITANNSLLV